MRIKFLRILPETCASTWCLFSSSTLNIALGSGSTTTAITSIASSLLIQPQLLDLFRQNHRPISGDRHAVFEVSTVAAVFGHCRPLIIEHSRTRLAYVHHGLDCQHHAVAQLRSLPGSPVVRNLRVLV